MPRFPTGCTFQIDKKENFYLYPTIIAEKLGLDPEIWCLKKKGLKKQQTLFGVTIKRFSYISLIKHLFLDKGIALIYTHLRPFPPSLLASLTNKPTTLIPHTYGLGSNFLIKKISLFFMKRFTKVICLTPYEEEIYKKNGLKNTILLPHAINYKFFSKKNKEDVRNKLNLKRNDFVIVTFANFRKFKNLDVMVNAFKIFNNKVKGSKFIIIGKDLLQSDFYKEQKKQKGPTSIKELIEKTKTNNSVSYLGELNHKDLKDVLYTSDLFVNSSDPETMGIAVYEAASTGLPLCLSDIGSFRTVFGEYVLYNKPKDPIKLAENFMAYYKSKKLRKKNSIYLKKKMKEWNYQNTTRKIEKLLGTLIKRNKK